MSFRVSLGCHLGIHSKFLRVSCMVSLGLIYGFFRGHLGFHVEVSYQEFLLGFL